MSKKAMFKRNSLVQYKGGGYDGCFWEWNYAYIDREGEFHDIASSGCFGCDTYEKLKLARFNRPKDFDIYDMNSRKDRNRFADEAPISHLLGVAKWFLWNDEEIVLRAKCDECGERFNVIDCEGECSHGIGGIAIEYGKLLCPEHALLYA